MGETWNAVSLAGKINANEKVSDKRNKRTYFIRSATKRICLKNIYQFILKQTKKCNNFQSDFLLLLL